MHVEKMYVEFKCMFKYVCLCWITSMLKKVHVVIKYVQKKCMLICVMFNYLYVEFCYVELFACWIQVCWKMCRSNPLCRSNQTPPCQPPYKYSIPTTIENVFAGFPKGGILSLVTFEFHFCKVLAYPFLWLPKLDVNLQMNLFITKRFDKSWIFKPIRFNSAILIQSFSETITGFKLFFS